MCGIAAIFHLDGRMPSRARLNKMCAALAHRGPDSEGVVRFSRHRLTGISAGLGHRRLSIIDPSPAGKQPMSFDDGALSIVFNGEIFNFQALRGRLVAEGAAFRTKTDTEVLLAMYRFRGPEMLAELNGMFAFALWDNRNGRALVARDRFGIKPLYYLEHEREVLVASELRGILAGLEDVPPMDPEAVELLLTLRYIPSPWSIYKGIRKLRAGHVLTVDEGGIQVRPWYTLPQRSGADGLEPEVSRQSLFRLLDDSVRLRMISDRPLGCFLSGGLDSSVIAALAARHTSHPLETFSVTFPREKMYDESFYSRAVASFLGTSHHEVPLSSDDILDAIPAVLDTQDEPFADSSALPTYLLSKVMRDRIVVALSGDGADELFGGYRKYQGELLHRYYFALPRILRRGLLEPVVRHLPESHSSGGLEALRRVRRFVNGARRDQAERLLGWMMLYSSEDLRTLFRQGGVPGSARDLVLERIRQSMGDDPDTLNRALRTDVQLCLSDQMMTKVDRMSMRFGLEVRTPFLDFRVVELALRLPGAEKIQLGRGKKIVLDTFASILPREILRRPKRGFEVPLASWFKGPLRELVMDLLSSEAVRGQPWIDPGRVRTLLDEHQRGLKENSWLLWSSITLLWWIRRTRGGK